MTDEVIRADAHTDRFHRDQQWHKPVRAATTGSITISTGLNNGDTIDGVTLATGDRVLVKDQGSSANGIYVVGASPGRAYDFLTGVQAMGAFVYVIDGTANGGSVWYNTNTSLPTIGATTLTFDKLGTGTGSLDVSDGTTTVSPTSLLSFDPTDFTVTDLGSGEASVAFSGTPGGGADDTIPAGGTLHDGTSTTGWTPFGSQDTWNADSTVPGAFFLQKTTMGGNNLVGVYRAVGGSFPRTYTMRIRDSLFHADFQSPVMHIAEASPGKFFTWGAVRDGVSNKYHQRYSWNSATSAGSNTNYNGGVNIANPAQWYRLVVNSSTDVEFWHSYNGFIWYRYAAAVNPGFTVGAFGFGMSTFAAIEMAIAVDWIHES